MKDESWLFLFLGIHVFLSFIFRLNLEGVSHFIFGVFLNLEIFGFVILSFALGQKYNQKELKGGQRR